MKTSPYFSLNCPSSWFWGIFPSYHVHSLKFYCVNSGLQPTVWSNPRPCYSRLPENKTLLLKVWTYFVRGLNYLEKYFCFCPLYICLFLPHFILFSFPFSFSLTLHPCDANAGPVASVQSRGLFWADITTVLHNLCLSCSLQSHFLCAYAALCCYISQAHINTDSHLTKRVSVSSLV